MSEKTKTSPAHQNPHPTGDAKGKPANPTPSSPSSPPEEIGGRGGLDPVRYGDWEIGGKCVDF